MKFAYPASNQISQLNDTQRTVKIARHSPCSSCTNCPGLRPPYNVHLILDDHIIADSSLRDLGQYGSDVDDEDADLGYLNTCTCGHEAAQHNADEHRLGPAEFARKARVAVRLDEILQASLTLVLITICITMLNIIFKVHAPTYFHAQLY